MKISTKGRYGVRLMVSLAVNYKNGRTSLREIAKNQEISEKYLEQIINPLTKAGLVNSFRGSQGGYALTFPPEEITVGRVLRVLEGSLAPVDCSENNEACERIKNCVTYPLWVRLKEAIENVVDNVTLADLAREYREKNYIDFII